MIKIAIPTVDILYRAWDEIEPFMQKAIDESNAELNLDAIKRKIDDRELLVATIFKDKDLIAAVSFEVTVFESGKRVLHINLAGGEHMDLWYADIDELATQLAKKQNCSEVYIVGRKGWERQLKHRGYKHVHTIISREVK